MDRAAPPRVRLLGVEVDLVTPADVMAATERFIAERRVAVVANHNAHSLALTRRSQAMADYFAGADLIEIDSTPMIAWGRMLGLPVRGDHRCTYLDWRELFWRTAEARGWRVFYLGGAPGVAETARARLRERWPNAVIGVRHGYFDIAASSDNRAVLDEIEAFDPDVLLVGMGMPRQEAWILANRSALSRGVIFSVGAAFDYEAGVQRAAPRWMGAAGLEWLFRLVSQPRRLAYRYLVEPWFLLPAMLDDLRARRQLAVGAARARL